MTIHCKFFVKKKHLQQQQMMPQYIFLATVWQRCNEESCECYIHLIGHNSFWGHSESNDKMSLNFYANKMSIYLNLQSMCNNSIIFAQE